MPLAAPVCRLRIVHVVRGGGASAYSTVLLPTVARATFVVAI